MILILTPLRLSLLIMIMVTTTLKITAANARYRNRLDRFIMNSSSLSHTQDCTSSAFQLRLILSIMSIGISSSQNKASTEMSHPSWQKPLFQCIIHSHKHRNRIQYMYILVWHMFVTPNTRNEERKLFANKQVTFFSHPQRLEKSLIHEEFSSV